MGLWLGFNEIEYLAAQHMQTPNKRAPLFTRHPQAARGIFPKLKILGIQAILGSQVFLPQSRL